MIITSVDVGQIYAEGSYLESKQETKKRRARKKNAG
jgi:hypothetical protein